MKLRKMRRSMMGFSLIAVMGLSLLSTGTGILSTVKAAEPEKTETTFEETTAEDTATSSDADELDVTEPEEEILVEDTLRVDANQVRIDATNFPDENFRKYIKENFDANNDDIVDDIENIKEIRVSFCEIHSLKGIEFFGALWMLGCSDNKLTSLDVSKNTALKVLDCDNNKLTSLDVSNTALEFLDCSDNELTSLDVSKNMALEYLNCRENQLTSLDVSKNTALKTIHCWENELTSLDVSKNMALEFLDCNNNQLTSLDVSKNTALKTIYCYSNQLTSIDVSKSTALERFLCYNNHLTSLDVSKNTTLRIINCAKNQLTSLDVSKNTALEAIHCWENELTSLDVSKNTALKVFHCYENQLTSLDVSKNTALENFACYNNELTSLDVSNNRALEVLFIDSNITTDISDLNLLLLYIGVSELRGTIDLSNITGIKKYMVGSGWNSNTKKFTYELAIKDDYSAWCTTGRGIWLIYEGHFTTYKGCKFYKDVYGNITCNDSNGNPVINEFKCDGTYTYYFQADGTAVKNRYIHHPDGKHVIYFDENGHEIFSNTLVASYQGYNFITDVNGNIRCYDSNGNPVINEFKCDGTYTYYFQLDGTAMRNRLTYHPDGKHIIYFDENGHEVFSNFHHVEQSIAGDAVDDLCFFDVYGYMYVDVMTYDQAGEKLYYVNPYGVIEQGKWFEFSDTCVWAGTTNKVGKGYGYANADGTLLINTYTYDWLGRYVYLQGNGHVQ